MGRPIRKQPAGDAGGKHQGIQGPRLQPVLVESVVEQLQLAAMAGQHPQGPAGAAQMGQPQASHQPQPCRQGQGGHAEGVDGPTPGPQAPIPGL